ncbi:hypothetical protein [Phyllobacterium sp. 22552]|uniref:hypothetical protein n=1 Tax=Phyllobacterium sp. 22552 TaxID=3453941 RepID=UPI003F84361A
MKYRFCLLLLLVLVAACNDSGSKSDTSASTFSREINELKAKNENLENDKAVLAKQADDLEQARASTAVEINALKSKLKKLTDELANYGNLESDKAALAKQVSDLEKTRADLEKARDGNATDMRALKSKLKELSDELAKPGEDSPDLLKQVKEIKASLVSLESKKTELDGLLGEVALELAKVKDTAEADKAALAKQVSDLEKARADLEKAHDGNVTEMKAHKSKLKELSDELAKPGEDSPDLLKQVKEIKASLVSLESKRAELDGLLGETALELAKVKDKAAADKAALLTAVSVLKLENDYMREDLCE